VRAGLCHALGEEFKHNKPAEFDVFRLVNHAHPVATEVLDHDKDFENLAKMYVSAYETVPNVHWATFQLMYGQQSGTAYAVFSPLKSASEVDQELVMGKQFEQSMGEETERSVGSIDGKCPDQSVHLQSAGKLCIRQVGSRRSLLEGGREACQTLAVDPHSDTGPCFGDAPEFASFFVKRDRGFRPPARTNTRGGSPICEAAQHPQVLSAGDGVD